MTLHDAQMIDPKKLEEYDNNTELRKRFGVSLDDLEKRVDNGEFINPKNVQNMLVLACKDLKEGTDKYITMDIEEIMDDLVDRLNKGEA